MNSSHNDRFSVKFSINPALKQRVLLQTRDDTNSHTVVFLIPVSLLIHILGYLPVQGISVLSPRVYDFVITYPVDISVHHSTIRSCIVYKLVESSIWLKFCVR